MTKSFVTIADLSKEKIIDELQSCSGTQFDPEIVPYMLEMIRDEVVPAKETPWQDVELKLG